MMSVLIVVFIQAAEVRIGTKRVLIAQFGVQTLVAFIMTLYLYPGDYRRLMKMLAI